MTARLGFLVDFLIWVYAMPGVFAAKPVYSGRMSARDVLRRHWPVAPILAYFLVWASYGLRCGFSYDDATNLYVAWVKPAARLFTQLQDRPVGGLFYRAVYAAAGFQPAPFHLACFVLLGVNLVLLYIALKRLAASRDVAVAALLFGCFHGAMWDIYTGVAMVYDILCGTLVLAAIALYVGGRKGVAALTVLALCAKEMALALPAFLLLYELLLRPRQPVRYYLRRIGPSALVCAAYVAWRLFVPNPLTGHPAYTPLFTPSRLLETATVYTRLLTSGVVTFHPALFWGAAIGAALAARSRLMLFGVLAFLAGMLPMAFVTPRTMGYPLYVPMFGLALYVGAGFVLLRDRIAPRRPVWAWAAFAGAVIALHAWQAAPSLRVKAGPGGQDQINEVLRQFPKLQPTVAPEARFLLIDAPFGEERWVPMFVVALAYHEPRVTVVNARAEPGRVGEPFDHVLVYRAGEWSRAGRPR